MITILIIIQKEEALKFKRDQQVKNGRKKVDTDGIYKRKNQEFEID